MGTLCDFFNGHLYATAEPQFLILFKKFFLNMFFNDILLLFLRLQELDIKTKK